MDYTIVVLRKNGPAESFIGDERQVLALLDATNHPASGENPIVGVAATSIAHERATAAAQAAAAEAPVESPAAP